MLLVNYLIIKSNPIVGASNKKFIKSVSSSDSRKNSDEDMCSGNEDQQWESELMLKGHRWSVSKGFKSVPYILAYKPTRI